MGVGRIGPCAAALAVAVLLAAPSGAQQPPRLFPGPEEQPTFRADVTLITNDVIVRDESGRFVPDLLKEDFQIYEDGVQQEIASLVLIQGGRAFNLQMPAPAPVAEGIILPTARPRSDTAGRVLMLFVDDLHMEADSTPRIRALFKQIAETLVHEGDLFAMVSSGPSSIAIDLTYDRALLDAAIGKIMGNGMTPSDIIRGPQGSRGPSELFYRANVAVSTALDIIRALGGVQHRRKAIIYVSAGYDLNPFEQSRFDEANTFAGRFRLDDIETAQGRAPYVNPFMQQTNYAFSDLDLANHLRRLTRAANRANATFYHDRSAGPGCRRRHRRDGGATRFEAVVRLRAQVAGQSADAGRGHGRVRGRQPEQLRRGTAADRRRDQRLLRHRLLLEQLGRVTVAPETRDRRQPRRPRRLVADRVRVGRAGRARAATLTDGRPATRRPRFPSMTARVRATASSR